MSPRQNGTCRGAQGGRERMRHTNSRDRAMGSDELTAGTGR